MTTTVTALTNRLLRTFPSTNNPVGGHTVRVVLSRISLSRSVYLSWRHRGLFLVARGARLKLSRTARVEFAPHSALAVGFEQEAPIPPLLHMGAHARFEVEGLVQITRGSSVIIHGGAKLRVGARSVFQAGSVLTCWKHIDIGADGGLGWNAMVMDTNAHTIVIDDEPRPVVSPVRIGDNVWIGAGSIILKGATIGDNAIIAAGSVVVSDVDSATLVGGNPARVIHKNVTWIH